MVIKMFVCILFISEFVRHERKLNFCLDQVLPDLEKHMVINNLLIAELRRHHVLDIEIYENLNVRKLFLYSLFFIFYFILCRIRSQRKEKFINNLFIYIDNLKIS